MLVLGGLISVAYASTTIITDTGITTTNLTVLGLCTGCGATEGSFSTWTTAFNGTVAGTSGIGNGGLIQINNNGTMDYLDGNGFAVIVTSAGVVTKVVATTGGNNGGSFTTAQSLTGVYQIIFDQNNDKIQVFKNGVTNIKNIGFSPGQFTFGFGNRAGIAISPNGKWIGMQAEDSGGALNRVVIFQGS